MNSRQKMVEEIRIGYGLKDTKVLSVMLKVPREEFVPADLRYLAYDDSPVAIGFDQTVSQPYTIAFMTHLLNLQGSETVLEIGTGSGYQAAILSLLAKKVFTIERIHQLADQARKKLKDLGYLNIEVKGGQGEEGWEEKAPFDAVLITAGIEKIPQRLLKQLKEEGILVAPVGRGMDKVMTKCLKKEGKIIEKEYGIFHFVPFVESN